ncbi:hypothetical protein HPB48_013237 [Haemaphysalis longicornis]|uniref:Uncharacterized protein n=1 Tax=Haemaphysalis longicornis TaxID=44386 RepID=A0A9J6GB51_HAELO|nr:hypothetical protein HPB48_013237 [Haemaphysalis longicornis]
MTRADAVQAHRSSTDISDDEEMDLRGSQEDGITTGGNNDTTDWITVTSRAQRRRMKSQAITPTTTLTPPKSDLRPSRSPRKPKLPPPPADDYKLAIRPRNGLPLSKVSPMALSDCILREANLQPEGTTIRARIDENQNILIVSTPSPDTAAGLSKIEKLTIGNGTFEVSSYGVSPDNSCKGVIHNIHLEATPDEIMKAISAPGFEPLTYRRLGNSTTIVITFMGKKVHCMVYVGGVETRCYLYKRTVAHCHVCHKTGHREDVCLHPPSTPKCKDCGVQLTSDQHECHPQCTLCGGAHTTASKKCPKRSLPPINRRKGGGPPTNARSSRSLSVDARKMTPNSRSQSRNRRDSSQAPTKSGKESGRRSRSRSKHASKTRPPSTTRGIGASQVSWAKVTSPKAQPPLHHPEITQVQAQNARLLEENAILKAELASLRAELSAMREEFLSTRSIAKASTQSSPPEKRKRAEKSPIPPKEQHPNHPQNAQPTPSIPTLQQMEELITRSTESIQATLEKYLTDRMLQFDARVTARIVKLEEHMLPLVAPQQWHSNQTSQTADPHQVTPLFPQDGSTTMQ